jgi:hypothetical protein
MRIEAVAANLVGQRDPSGAFYIAFSIRKWVPPWLASCRGQPYPIAAPENQPT